MKNYVVGFVFSKDFESVLLMHKNRPDWQKGLVNGLGGKVEEGESIHACVKREIYEECGLVTTEEQWIRSGKIYSPTMVVDFFGTTHDGEMSDAVTKEDEEVEWFKVNNLPHNLVENITWLIHITLDKLKNNHFEAFEVAYKI